MPYRKFKYGISRIHIQRVNYAFELLITGHYLNRGAAEGDSTPPQSKLSS
jgi:hypothetical protein